MNRRSGTAYLSKGTGYSSKGFAASKPMPLSKVSPKTIVSNTSKCSSYSNSGSNWEKKSKPNDFCSSYKDKTKIDSKYKVSGSNFTSYDKPKDKSKITGISSKTYTNYNKENDKPKICFSSSNPVTDTHKNSNTVFINKSSNNNKYVGSSSLIKDIGTKPKVTSSHTAIDIHKDNLCGYKEIKKDTGSKTQFNFSSTSQEKNSRQSMYPKLDMKEICSVPSKPGNNNTADKVNSSYFASSAKNESQNLSVPKADGSNKRKILPTFFSLGSSHEEGKSFGNKSMKSSSNVLTGTGHADSSKPAVKPKPDFSSSVAFSKSVNNSNEKPEYNHSLHINSSTVNSNATSNSNNRPSISNTPHHVNALQNHQKEGVSNSGFQNLNSSQKANNQFAHSNLGTLCNTNIARSTYNNRLTIDAMNNSNTAYSHQNVTPSVLPTYNFNSSQCNKNEKPTNNIPAILNFSQNSQNQCGSTKPSQMSSSLQNMKNDSYNNQNQTSCIQRNNHSENISDNSHNMISQNSRNDLTVLTQTPNSNVSKCSKNESKTSGISHNLQNSIASSTQTQNVTTKSRNVSLENTATQRLNVTRGLQNEVMSHSSLQSLNTHQSQPRETSSSCGIQSSNTSKNPMNRDTTNNQRNINTSQNQNHQTAASSNNAMSTQRSSVNETFAHNTNNSNIPRDSHNGTASNKPTPNSTNFRVPQSDTTSNFISSEQLSHNVNHATVPSGLSPETDRNLPSNVNIAKKRPHPILGKKKFKNSQSRETLDIGAANSSRWSTSETTSSNKNYFHLATLASISHKFGLGPMRKNNANRNDRTSHDSTRDAEAETPERSHNCTTVSDSRSSYSFPEVESASTSSTTNGTSLFEQNRSRNLDTGPWYHENRRPTQFSRSTRNTRDSRTTTASRPYSDLSGITSTPIGMNASNNILRPSHRYDRFVLPELVREIIRGQNSQSSELRRSEPTPLSPVTPVTPTAPLSEQTMDSTLFTSMGYSSRRIKISLKNLQDFRNAYDLVTEILEAGRNHLLNGDYTQACAEFERGLKLMDCILEVSVDHLQLPVMDATMCISIQEVISADRKSALEGFSDAQAGILPPKDLPRHTPDGAPPSYTDVLRQDILNSYSGNSAGMGSLYSPTDSNPLLTEPFAWSRAPGQTGEGSTASQWDDSPPVYPGSTSSLEDDGQGACALPENSISQRDTSGSAISRGSGFERGASLNEDVISCNSERLGLRRERSYVRQPSAPELEESDYLPLSVIQACIKMEPSSNALNSERYSDTDVQGTPAKEQHFPSVEEEAGKEISSESGGTYMRAQEVKSKSGIIETQKHDDVSPSLGSLASAGSGVHSTSTSECTANIAIKPRSSPNQTKTQENTEERNPHHPSNDISSTKEENSEASQPMSKVNHLSDQTSTSLSSSVLSSVGETSSLPPPPIPSITNLKEPQIRAFQKILNFPPDVCLPSRDAAQGFTALTKETEKNDIEESIYKSEEQNALKCHAKRKPPVPTPRKIYLVADHKTTGVQDHRSDPLTAREREACMESKALITSGSAEVRPAGPGLSIFEEPDELDYQRISRICDEENAGENCNEENIYANLEEMREFLRKKLKSRSCEHLPKVDSSSSISLNDFSQTRKHYSPKDISLTDLSPSVRPKISLSLFKGKSPCIEDFCAKEVFEENCEYSSKEVKNSLHSELTSKLKILDNSVSTDILTNNIVDTKSPLNTYTFSKTDFSNFPTFTDGEQANSPNIQNNEKHFPHQLLKSSSEDSPYTPQGNETFRRSKSTGHGVHTFTSISSHKLTLSPTASLLREFDPLVAYKEEETKNMNERNKEDNVKHKKVEKSEVKENLEETSSDSSGTQSFSISVQNNNRNEKSKDSNNYNNNTNFATNNITANIRFTNNETKTNANNKTNISTCVDTASTNTSASGRTNQNSEIDCIDSSSISIVTTNNNNNNINNNNNSNNNNNNNDNNNKSENENNVYQEEATCASVPPSETPTTPLQDEPTPSSQISVYESPSSGSDPQDESPSDSQEKEVTLDTGITVGMSEFYAKEKTESVGKVKESKWKELLIVDEVKIYFIQIENEENQTEISSPCKRPTLRIVEELNRKTVQAPPKVQVVATTTLGNTLWTRDLTFGTGIVFKTVAGAFIFSKTDGGPSYVGLKFSIKTNFSKISKFASVVTSHTHLEKEISRKNAAPSKVFKMFDDLVGEQKAEKIRITAKDVTRQSMRTIKFAKNALNSITDQPPQKSYEEPKTEPTFGTFVELQKLGKLLEKAITENTINFF